MRTSSQMLNTMIDETIQQLEEIELEAEKRLEAGADDRWLALLRNAVVWAGMADPGATRQEVQRESDREAMLLRQLLHAWSEADPHEKGMTVVDAIKEAEGNSPALATVFVELADRSGKVNARSVGQKLRHLMGRVCGGKYFDRRDTNRGAAWVVRTTGGRDSNDSSDSNPNPPTRAHTRAHTQHAPSRAGATVTTPPTVTPCNHLNPSSWVREGDQMLCPGCGKWMGRAKQQTVA